MNLTITLTPTDLARIAEIRKLREAAGRPSCSDEATVQSALSLGIYEELLSERAYAEARESGPFSTEFDIGFSSLLREQAA